MQANNRVRADASGAQHMGQRIGARVQVRIRQAFAFKGQRFGIRGAGDLRLECLMDALVGRVVRGGRVPVIENYFALYLGKDCGGLAFGDLCRHVIKPRGHQSGGYRAHLARIGVERVPRHRQGGPFDVAMCRQAQSGHRNTTRNTGAEISGKGATGHCHIKIVLHAGRHPVV